MEDEAPHAALVQRAFDRDEKATKLEIAGSLEAARARIQETPPLIVIADYVLPDGKGIELIPPEPSRASYPIVLLTSHGNEELAVEAMKAGALDYVVKSDITLADMPHIAERAIREWNSIQTARRAEQDRKRFESIVHATTDLVAMADPTGNVLYLNPAGRRLLGISQTDGLPPMTIDHLFPRTTSETVVTAAIAMAVRDGDWSGDATLLTSNNVEVPVSLVLVAHKDQTGRVEFLSTIARDITEQRKAEQAAREHDIASAKLSVLSPRENEVLDLVVLGEPNKSIAAQLSLSEKTIEKHRASLMRKLKVRTVAELVRLAVAAKR